MEKLSLLAVLTAARDRQPDAQPAEAQPHATLDERLFAAHDAATSADDAAIDALFASGHCEHAYIDVGTNVGVQIRKLYEPHLYPGATVHSKFDRVFGPALRDRLSLSSELLGPSASSSSRRPPRSPIPW